MKTMMMILGLTSLIAAGVSAQSFGEIHGRLVDQHDQPLPFASVVTDAGSKTIGTMTDEDGRFRLKPLSPGIYNLTFSMMSYKKREMTGVAVDADKIRNLGKIVLHEEAYMIGGEVIVEAFADNLISYDGENMTVIRAEEIALSPVKRDIRTLVSSLTSDVYQSPSDGQLYFRGSRGGNVLYFVDGVKMNQDPRLPASGLGSVMVYSGGVPAKFGDCVGGFVIIETKNYFDLYNQYMARQKALAPPATDELNIE